MEDLEAPTPALAGLPVTVAVLVMALICGLASEACSWYLTTQRPDYTELVDDIDRLTKKLDKAKESQPKLVKSRENIKSQEDTIRQKNSELSKLRMKGQLLATLLYFAAFPLFNRLFGGLVVAKLPFEPILFLRSLAHRGLTTFQETDCSATYLYILAVSFFRTNIGKLITRNPIKSVYGTGVEGGLAGMFQQAAEMQQQQQHS